MINTAVIPIKHRTPMARICSGLFSVGKRKRRKGFYR